MTIIPRTKSLQTGLVVFAGIIFIGAASAPAFASDQATSRPAARADNDRNQRICVRAETTGRRIAPLVCRTRAEWKRTGELEGRD